MTDRHRPAVTPPVLVTGMHRCGTTLLVRLLRALGGHFGAHTDPNAEDFFFMRLDEWVMRRAGGAWDWPLPTLTFLRHPRFFEDAAELLADAVAGPRFAEFTGGRSLGPALGPWGFKDPRAVFTFALWARVFPGAKLLVIRRNGVDAAHSLATREAARWSPGPRDDAYLRIRPLMGRWQDVLKSTESFENKLFSTRCLALEDAFALWEEYVAEGEALLARYDGPKLVLSYEHLIAEPEAQLERAASFCGLGTDPAAIREAVRGIDRTRAYAFLGAEPLRRFYAAVRESRWMRELGYDAVPGAEGPR
ncbi:MAG: sulfotransferase [Acidobacteria bacterium]|nr:sulfotransferase [Acidobacteriota bacterium]